MMQGRSGQVQWMLDASASLSRLSMAPSLFSGSTHSVSLAVPA